MISQRLRKLPVFSPALNFVGNECERDREPGGVVPQTSPRRVGLRIRAVTMTNGLVKRDDVHSIALSF